MNENKKHKKKQTNKTHKRVVVLFDKERDADLLIFLEGKKVGKTLRNALRQYMPVAEQPNLNQQNNLVNYYQTELINHLKSENEFLRALAIKELQKS